VDNLEPDTFDGAWSNFGPLNCVANLPAAARAIARRVRPGGILVASVIGRVCPWEIGLELARGQWQRARLRFSRAFVPVPLNGRRIWTVHSPRVRAVVCRGGVARQSQRACALALAVSEGLAVRHLAWWVPFGAPTIGAHLPGVRAWGDHFLVVMRKRGGLAP
jgi:SAM-dependent methyltransferase